MTSPALAETVRIATYNVELGRDGPGLLLRDLRKGQDPAIAAAVEVITALQADVLVLTGFDYDLDQLALAAFSEKLAAAGSPYPFSFALPPNTGIATGLDLDSDGYLGGPGDAQGWGRFSGAEGMAILSSLPIRANEARDFSGFLWRDLPGALLFDGMTEQAKDLQRLSSTGHWEVPVDLPDGSVLRLLVWHATPPVFDGPEDRNGRRNHDEAMFWLKLLDGALPDPAPAAPFVLLGDANLDPVRGDGMAAALDALLADPRLQDPVGLSSNQNGAHPPASHPLATADFSANDGPGPLRVDYVLPSADLDIAAAGVLWPEPGTPLALSANAASRHRPVWVDITLP